MRARTEMLSLSFPPSAAAKSLLNKKPDGVKVRSFALDGRDTRQLAPRLLQRLASEAPLA